MLIAGANSGNPWHGTWTEAGLELPNTTVLDLANPPEGDAAACPDWTISDSARSTLWPSFGDCFLIRFPDQPAVETSEDEAAVGMEWLAYAVFCGARHALYDVNIGRNCWVYIDSSGDPWLAKMEQMTPREDTEWRLTITFSRNFEFGGPEESHTHLAASVGGWNTGTGDNWVLDASETGRCMAFGYYRYQDNYLAEVSGVTLLFSGVPGVDLDSLFVGFDTTSENTLPYDYWGNYERTGGIVSTLSNGTVGNIFDGDTRISVQTGYDYTVSDRVLIPNTTTFYPTTITGNILIVCDHGTIEVPVEQTKTYDSSGDPDETTTMIAGYEYTVAGSVSSEFFGAIPVPEVWRRSNKVIEVVLCTDTGEPFANNERHSICLVLPDRFVMTGYLIPQNNPDRYFSYHPVTKELLESSSPACFM